MWPTNTGKVSIFRRRKKEELRVDNRASHEIGVVFAKDEFACVLVDGVGDRKVTEERSAKETGNIGIIHSVC